MRCFLLFVYFTSPCTPRSSSSATAEFGTIPAITARELFLIWKKFLCCNCTCKYHNNPNQNLHKIIPFYILPQPVQPAHFPPQTALSGQPIHFLPLFFSFQMYPAAKPTTKPITAKIIIFSILSPSLKVRRS